MIRVVDQTPDAGGAVIRSAVLPVIFENRSEAVTFLQEMLRRLFTLGRSGYQLEGDYG